jgi:hypothetical protein
MLQQPRQQQLLLVDMRRFRCFSLNRVLSAGSMRIRLDRLFLAIKERGPYRLCTTSPTAENLFIINKRYFVTCSRYRAFLHDMRSSLATRAYRDACTLLL